MTLYWSSSAGRNLGIGNCCCKVLTGLLVTWMSQQHFPIPKFRPAEDDQCNVIYKIPCASCPWSYIGETKRSFTTRRKEHMRNLKHCTKGSNVAKHAWTFNHDIDFNNSKIIDKANNRSRKTLESWHTAKTVGADNNSCLLPRQYHIL